MLRKRDTPDKKQLQFNEKYLFKQIYFNTIFGIRLERLSPLESFEFPKYLRKKYPWNDRARTGESRSYKIELPE